MNHTYGGKNDIEKRKDLVWIAVTTSQVMSRVYAPNVEKKYNLTALPVKQSTEKIKYSPIEAKRNPNKQY